MTIEIQKTETVVIGLPSFTKNDKQIYACISEDNVIEISTYESGTVIINKTSSIKNAYSIGYSLITKDEFFAKYNSIVDTIHDDMEQNIAAINLMCEDGAGEVAEPGEEELKYEQKQQGK